MPSKKEAATELLRRRKARVSLIDYANYLMPNFEPSWHHTEICEKLEAVERGEIKRLIITMPPRHSKSLLSSEFFPSWFIGKNPEKQIITSSYGADLASDFGRKVRNIVRSEEFSSLFPDVELSSDSTAANRWNTSKKGVYVAAGVGGAITGKGADIAIIDDPLKNREDANSVTIRNKVWDWYTSTLYTRLMPGGAIIAIQTRWHNDDLVGRLLKEQETGDKWEVLNFPAINDQGEALWDAWYPIEELKKIKRVVGSRDFSALYQQDPSGDDVSGFKDEWLNYWDATNLNNMSVYIICDPASAKKKSSDYTVFLVIGVGHDGNIYIIDMIRDRLSLTEKSNALFMLHQKYNPVAVGYEKYGMQTDIEHFEYRMRELNYRFHITELGGSMAKEDRIRRLVPLFEDGRVFLPEICVKTDYQGNSINLTNSFIHDEYQEFPVSTHDDMLDCLARVEDPDFIIHTDSHEKQAVVLSQAEKDWRDVLGINDSDEAFCMA